MKLNIAKEVAALNKMTTLELRAKFAQVFGERTAANNRTWLVRRIVWRVQANAEGDLSERAKRRAAELANDADLRVVPPKTLPTPELAATKTLRFQPDERLPAPGTVITRPYKGETLQVKVLERGFEFEGKVYGTLSAVAKAITGSHCNGFHFFRMNGGGRRPRTGSRSASPRPHCRWCAARSTRGRALRRDSSRSSTRSMRSARPGRRTSPARNKTAGSASTSTTTMEVSRAATWTGRP
jgi:Protein of unknown function (DUF2924)